MITPSFSLTATERVLPSLALDFTTASLDSRITFTRTGATATRVNASGFIESVAADTPRFDFDPITLACKGLLIEESRSNRIGYSNGFDLAFWGKLRASVSGGAITSPSGTLSAYKLIEDESVSNSHVTYVLSTGSIGAITIGNTYTFSIFLRAGERTQVGISADFANSNLGGIAIFDLSNGTIVSGSNGTIKPAGGGFYRCSVTNVATGTTARPGILLALNGSTSYTGDGSSGAYIWGAQFEAGAFATSYIPTSGSAVTRNADVATMTGTNFSDWFNASAGTFFIETNARNGDDLLTAGSYVLTADATALKKYATTYGADPSATQLDFGKGTIQRVMYYPHELIAAELAALVA